MQIFKTFNLTIKLVLPEKINLLDLQVHVPSIELENNIKTISDFTIMFEQSNAPSLDCCERTLIIKNRWSTSVKEDIAHLVYTLCRQHWINQGYYPVHSVCMDDRLFIGHSGCGKTSLALCALKNNLIVSSFNKTVVEIQDKMQVMACTQAISQRNAPSILGEKQSYPTINHLYLFVLNEKPLQVLDVSPDSAVHQLYPFFLDTIKQDVILTGNLVYSGFTHIDRKVNLIKLLRQWLEAHPLKVLIGKKEHIIEAIKNEEL